MIQLALILLCVGFGVIQALTGGARLAYALPAYALIGIAGAVAIRGEQGREGRGASAVCLLSAVVLAGYVFLRSRLAPVEYLARNDGLLALAALAVYALTAVHLSASRDRFLVLAALLAFAFFHVAVGAGQFRSGNDYMLLPWIERPLQYFSRASGFYISPDHLAGLLEMLALLSLAIFCWTHSRFASYLLAIYGVAVCLVGIAISGSRESYLAVILTIAVFSGMSLWVVRRLYPERLGLVLATSIALVALLAISSVNFVTKEERLSAQPAPAVERPDSRPTLRALALRIHESSPVFGTGSGSYLVHARRLRPPEVQGDPVHAHSDYYELLAEYGYVGVALAAIFLGAHLFTGIRGIVRLVRERAKVTKDKRSRDLALGLGAVAAVIVLLIHAASDFALHLPANALVAAFIFGMLANPGRSQARKERPAEAPPTALWMRLVAPVVGLVLLVLTVPKVRGEFSGERARLALRDQQYFRAKDSATAALKAEKKNPDLYYYYGEASHYLGLEQQDSDTRFQQYSEAAEAFAQGLALFPQDTRLLLKMGRTLGNLGRFDEATPFFERAIAADPNLGKVYASYAVHWQMQAQFEKAKEMYDKAKALGETDIVAAGTADLEKFRDRPFQRRQRRDILAEFITETDVVKEAEEKPAPDPKPAP